MNIHKTKNEAKQYCREHNISFSQIKKHNGSGWIVHNKTEPDYVPSTRIPDAIKSYDSDKIVFRSARHREQFLRKFGSLYDNDPDLYLIDKNGYVEIKKYSINYAETQDDFLLGAEDMQYFARHKETPFFEPGKVYKLVDNNTAKHAVWMYSNNIVELIEFYGYIGIKLENNRTVVIGGSPITNEIRKYFIEA